MKRVIMYAVLLVVFLVTPALAAKVYLKDGGIIDAKRVWHSGGRVHVLATRHTLTSFEMGEVDVKRTFPKHHRVSKRIEAVTSQAPAVAAVPDRTAAAQSTTGKKPVVNLPNLPKLPEKSPESLAPSSGSIRQHKKEMAEKIGE